MELTQEELNLHFNPDQREYLLEELKKPYYENIERITKELAEMFKSFILSYMENRLDKNILNTYKDCIQFRSNLYIPSKMYSLAEKELKATRTINPDYRFYFGSWDRCIFFEVDNQIPMVKEVCSIDDNLEKVFSSGQISLLLDKIKQLIICDCEREYLHREYYSDAGNCFGKIATWGELKSINKEWFDIVYKKYRNEGDVIESINLQKTTKLAKQGKSSEINNVLSELNMLAKHCNLY